MLEFRFAVVWLGSRLGWGQARGRCKASGGGNGWGREAERVHFLGAEGQMEHVHFLGAEEVRDGPGMAYQ